MGIVEAKSGYWPHRLDAQCESNSCALQGFLSKMKASLKKGMQTQGQTGDITGKELSQAYQSAEKEGKFTISRGMSGIQRVNELSQLMKWGEAMTEFGLLDEWRQMEVGSEGKTASSRTDLLLVSVLLWRLTRVSQNT